MPGGSAVDRLAARPGRGRVVAVVLAFLLLVGLALATWGFLQGRGPASLERAEREATSVARDRAVQLTSYTAETFDDDTAWARTGATPRFAREYAEANEPVGEVARRVGARAVGEVVDAAARATSARRVEVLLFVDQTITRDGQAPEEPERSRIVMTLVQRDGAWLVDEVALR